MKIIIILLLTLSVVFTAHSASIAATESDNEQENRDLYGDVAGDALIGERRSLGGALADLAFGVKKPGIGGSIANLAFGVKRPGIGSKIAELAFG